MRQIHDGLSLWYGTPDAPAPPETGARRAGSSLVVGVRPPSPANVVEVRYRVDGGLVCHMVAREIQTDFARQLQYFRATFPFLPEGSVVEYSPVLRSGGRQVPIPAVANGFPSRFVLEPPAQVFARRDAPVSAGPPAAGSTAQRFTPHLEFVSAVSCKLSTQPDVIGETPDGLRINFYLDGGHAMGPHLNARVLPRGADFMTIRRDGVGELKVRATFQTDDGGILDADYNGFIDLGPDGYERATRAIFPESVPVQLALRLMAVTPRYQWVNRHQFVGVGRASLVLSEVDYDLFVVSGTPVKSD